MLKRPVATIAILYAALIILFSPLIPRPVQDFKTKEDPALISSLREHFISVIQKTVPKPYDSLLGSIVFGAGASPLEADLKEDYRKVGLIHLLVASGTQVSILIGVCLALVRYSRIPVLIGVILTSVVNIIFTLMTGAGASMIRAAIMGEIALLGLLFDRESEVFTSLSLSALLMMIWDPLIIFDIGFQLSFAATWALVYLAPALEKRCGMFSVAIAPILATTPIVLFNFNQFSTVAVVVNSIVVPWIEVLTVLGFISTFLGSFFLPIAELLNGCLYLLLILLNEIVYTFSRLPGASLNLPSPPLWSALFYYFMIIALVEKWFDRKKALIFTLLFLLCFVWSAALSPAQGLNELVISVIDVGQGDSILVESPAGKNLLIDGGPKYKRGDAGRRFVLPFLRKKGINKLDIVVLTHPHDDHVGGLPSILKDIPVGAVIDSGQVHTSRAYLDFLKIIDGKDIPYKIARAGQKLDLGGGVVGEILNPREPLIEASAFNNNSVVIKLKYGKFRALFMGDAEREAEERIMVYDLNSTVLKVGHHGSKTSSSTKFLKAVEPEVAVISVGAKNKFHHPHPSAMKRLIEQKIKIFRTDLKGNIEIRSDGKTFSILPQRSEPQPEPRKSAR